MSDTLVVVGGSGSSAGGTSTPTPLPPLAALIIPAALSELRALLLRDEVRPTLIGISALRTLLLADLVEHVKDACKDHKKLVHYFTPDASPAPSPPGATDPTAATGQGAAAVPPSAHAVAEPAHSQFVTDFGDKMAAVVKMPFDQLHTTVDSQGKTIGTQGQAIDAQSKTIDAQGKAIDKGAADITGLQTAKTASDARIQVLEAGHQRLDIAHRALSNRVTEMGYELEETEEATVALGEAVREAEPPVIVVVEEGENQDPTDPPRTPQASPMRQVRPPLRKAPLRKKK